MKTILALLLAASTSFGAIYTPGSGGSGGGGTNATGTNFAGILLTNHLLRVVHDAGSTTNLVLPVSATNAVVWSPSNNCGLTLSGSWVSGVRQVIDLTLVLTNGQTSVTLPYAGPGGATVAIQTPPSTNALAIVSDGTRQWIESGVAAVNTNQFSDDGSAIKSTALMTNIQHWSGTVVRSTNLGTTITRSLTLTNDAAAATNAQQASPALLLSGSGYKTSATPAAQPVEAGFYLLPVQGSTAPTARLKFIYSINGGAYVDNGPYFETASGQGDFYVPGIGQITLFKAHGTFQYSNPAFITLNVGTSTNNAVFSSSTCFIRLTNSLAGANYDITGISSQAQVNSTALWLVNLSTLTANTITLKNEDAASTAAYRFHGPGNADYVLKSGAMVQIASVYDGVNYRWRIAGQ